MIFTTLQVAFGGAIGAALRFLAGVGIYRVIGHGAFPIAIVSVNVLGSFLMGVFVVFAAQRGMAHFNPFVMVGLLGGFTTFSAFSLETVNLIERGQFSLAALYIALSVVGSVGGLMLGLWLARGVFA